MELLWVYYEVTMELLWSYYEVTMRLLWSYNRNYIHKTDYHATR